ncbi:hypothetical protein VFPPC_17833 [Pochonia chlamydosporia 170]|uniref:Uncharacterized protein n=1 Tax=Pochonia chlamydosporia 170 TaxID=1380566 RepID=A0A219ARN2_METCM|nr:hypothetical protein VFPPC_17833 [Pochonia chlamydosporia 170]OWT42974.1 hypothetical protein VFPPC_17833 [Pochonia chlamydosporia 170]
MGFPRRNNINTTTLSMTFTSQFAIGAIKDIHVIMLQVGFTGAPTNQPALVKVRGGRQCRKEQQKTAYSNSLQTALRVAGGLCQMQTLKKVSKKITQKTKHRNQCDRTLAKLVETTPRTCWLNHSNYVAC